MQKHWLLAVVSDFSLENYLNEALLNKNFEISTANSIADVSHLLSISNYSTIIYQVDNICKKVCNFFEQIKESHKNIPIIVISDNNEPDFIIKLISLGVFACISKKFLKAEFLELLKIALKFSQEGESFQFKSINENWLELVIPAQILYIPRVSNLLEKLIDNVEAKKKKHLLYGVRELIQNSIEHGCHFCPEKKIVFRFIKTKKNLIFYIEDEGQGFDITSIPHAAIGSKKNEALKVMEYRKKKGMRPGGLGLASVFNIGDEIIHNEKGNGVILIKYLKDC